MPPIQIWAEAAKKANSTDPKKVAAMLSPADPGRRLSPVSSTRRATSRGAYVMYQWDDKGNYNQM